DLGEGLVEVGRNRGEVFTFGRRREPEFSANPIDVLLRPLLLRFRDRVGLLERIELIARYHLRFQKLSLAFEVRTSLDQRGVGSLERGYRSVQLRHLVLEVFDRVREIVALAVRQPRKALIFGLRRS